MHQEAALALRQVIEREPWRTSLWEQVGSAELAAARAPEAAAAFELAAGAGQISPEGRFQLAQVYDMAGEPAAAAAELKMLLGLPEPAPPELRGRAFEFLVDLQLAQGDFAAAVETLRAWHSAAPDDMRVVFLLGLHLTIINPGEAAAYLVDASQGDPVYTPTVQKIRRGLNLASEGDSPGYDWVMIGRALGSAGQWDLAAEAFRLATTAAPQYAEAWAFLAEAHYQTGRDGQPELERALALSPESVVVRTLVALNYRRQGNSEGALAYLSDIASQETDEPIWQVELAGVQAETGDLMGALQSYQKAVELAPATSLYWQYLARFSVEFGMDVRGTGLSAARQAVLLAPDDPAALDVMGWTMVSLSDFASAERFLQQALERDSAYALAHLHMAQLYLQQQDFERAYSYLKQAAFLSADDAVGQVARRLLRQYYDEGG